MRRSLELTSAELAVVCGSGVGAGRARAAARTLEGLDAIGVIERARARRVSSQADDVLSGILVLAPEAVASLLTALAKTLSDDLSGPEAPQRELGWSPRLELYDDATDADGLPLPFDLEGCSARRIELVQEGTLRPIPDDAPLAGGGGERQLGHLFLAAGDSSPEEMLATTEGGVWIGSLERLTCSDPLRLCFAGRARGVRRIASGRLAQALPDQHWSEELGRAFGSVVDIGRERVCVSAGDGILGGSCAPALAYRSSNGHQPRRASTSV